MSKQLYNNFNSESPATAKGCGINLASRERERERVDNARGFFNLIIFRQTLFLAVFFNCKKYV